MPQGINGDPLGHQEQRSRLDLHFRNLAHRRKTSEPIGSKGLCSIALRVHTQVGLCRRSSVQPRRLSSNLVLAIRNSIWVMVLRCASNGLALAACGSGGPRWRRCVHSRVDHHRNAQVIVNCSLNQHMAL
jgi:hypothetical protein